VELTSEQFPPLANLWPREAAKSDLLAFRYVDPDDPRPTWEPVRFQLDARDGAGRFLFSDQTKGPLGRPEKLRLLVASADFGERRNPFLNFPCEAREGYEISRDDFQGVVTAPSSKDDKQYVYLFRCPRERKVATPFSPAVEYDKATRALNSSKYLYRFNGANHMLFDEILLKEADGGAFPIARNSDLLIKADIKYFLSMTFGPLDVESVLERYRVGDVAVVGALSFYLKVLFFKIKLALTTDVSFFADSVHIPMNVHLPPGSGSRLRRGSGIFYSWTMTSPDQPEVLMPQTIFGTLPKTEEVVLRFCRHQTCTFSLQFPLPPAFGGGEKGSFPSLGTSTLSMVFRLNQKLVEQGFYPTWITEISQKSYKDFDLGDKDPEYFQRRVGVYFETSELQEGDHGWDFRISLQHREQECARALSIHGIQAPVKTKR
jgi:hypothetical protein